MASGETRRRSTFRTGLWLGLLLGLTVAIVKTVQSSRARQAAPPPWMPRQPEWPPVETGPEPAEPRATEPEPIAAEPEPIAAEAPAAARRPVAAPPVERAPAEPPARQPAGPTAAKAAPAKKAAKKAAKAAKKAAKTSAKGAAKTAPEPAEPRRPAPEPARWVEPVGGVCPPSHPIKAKLASRLFHLPGMFAYDRTRPDRCYRDETGAVADGLTRAKR